MSFSNPRVDPLRAVTEAPFLFSSKPVKITFPFFCFSFYFSDLFRRSGIDHINNAKHSQHKLTSLFSSLLFVCFLFFPVVCSPIHPCPQISLLPWRSAVKK